MTKSAEKIQLATKGDKLTMAVGEKFELDAHTKEEAGLERVYHFTTSNPEVALVSQEGEITAVETGKTRITVQSVGIPEVREVEVTVE